jgi:ribosomal protein S18 acetylase RimI-like enzyme
MNTEFTFAEQLITLHPVEPGYESFLLQLYASTRADEMALVDWSNEQKDAFIKMQLDAQTYHYRIHFPQAEYLIIKREGIPVGRMIIHQSEKQILLIDIAVLPNYRNKGIGTVLMKELMNEAGRNYLPVVLHVEFFNPVINLYTRLGFTKTVEMEVYHEMVWTPGGVQNKLQRPLKAERLEKIF